MRGCTRSSFAVSSAHAGGELHPVELIGARRRPLHQVSEAEAVVRQQAVVLGLEGLNAERLSRLETQN